MSDTLRVSNISFGNVASNFNQAQMGFTSVGLGSTSNYAFHQFFGTSNTLCWTANGTVGIGTTNPSAFLSINAGSSNTVALNLNSSGTGWGSGIQFVNTTVSTGRNYGIYSGSDSSLHIYDVTAGADRMTINSSGVTLYTAGNSSYTKYGPNSSSAYLVVGATGDNAGASTAQVITTNGNLHLDGGNSSQIYYGFYANSRATPNSHEFYGATNMFGNLALQNTTFIKYGTTSGYYMSIIGGSATYSPYLEFFVGGTRRCYFGSASTTDMTLAAENGAKLNFVTEGVIRMIIDTAGNVGIGMTAPVGLLSVLLNGSGTYNPSTWTTSYALFGPGANSATGSAVGITYNTAGGYGSLISLSAGVAWRNMVYSANEHYFYVTGTLAGYVNAGGFVSVSDEREKINIKNINTERSLQRILSCTPKTFQRIMDRADPMIPDEVKNKWHIGLNAQEVLSINPHCISEWKNQDGEARHGINYTDFVTHLIGSVQEIVKQNTSQAELISVQDAKIATLQSRMDVLEALVAKPT